MGKLIIDMTPEERTKLRKDSKENRTKLISDFISENPYGKGSYLKLIPPSCQWLLYKIYIGNCNKTAAIKGKCLDCCGYDNYREEIKECNVYNCPLWKFRPYQ